MFTAIDYRISLTDDFQFKVVVTYQNEEGAQHDRDIQRPQIMGGGTRVFPNPFSAQRFIQAIQ